ncbi:MAG TPA: nucleotidyl transferase AbiEii/AbiGii toxin family protein [Candidatus Binatia bacterium]|nr:nucleotidyl transferase AbiEii/AbiGii toxin family protein [Candidatus Binatia bacterium]
MPSASSPVVELLADLGQALSALALRWYLFGAQAAILHGVARLTADVDVTVDPGGRSGRELVAALAGGGFDLRVHDVGEFVDATRVLPFVHARTRLPVDVVLAGPGIEELFLANAQEIVLGDVRVPVAAPEDIITMKILAGRAKDFDDVVAIVRARGPGLDLGRTREMLRLLERALARADLLPELDRALARARA